MSINVEKVLRYLEGFDIEDFDSDKLAHELKTDQYYPMILWDYGYEIDEHLVVLTNVKEFDNAILENISKKISDFKDDKDFSKIEDIKIEIFNLIDDPLLPAVDAKTTINNLRLKLSSEFRTLKNKQISIHSLVVNDMDIPDFVTIDIESRVRSIEQEEEITIDGTKVILKSYVFAANLKSLLELYRIYGPDLFYKNVRNGIADELDVEKSIGDTLGGKTNSEFWHLNNGISLFVNDDSRLDFSSYRGIKLKLSKDSKKDPIPISVINGAQSITTAARHFAKVKHQKVLLRVYSFKKGDDVVSEKTSEQINDKKKVVKKSEKYNQVIDKLIDEITIALNRQKPIKIDDLSYASDFVKTINDNYDKDDNFSFELTRRGVLGGKHSYSLLNFAKIVSAYLVANPAESVSKGAITFLKIMENGHFKKDKVFRKEILNEDQSKNIIHQYYRPLNFAFELKKYLDKELKNIIDDVVKENKDDTAIRALKEYGVYFVLALLIRLIAKEKDTTSNDFSSWKYHSISDTEGQDGCLKQDIIRECVEKIVAAYFEYSQAEKLGADGNHRRLMKNNEIYTKMINYLDEKRD